jgi:lambda family phage portal protein
VNELRLNWLDRAVCWISPQWGYQRIAWKIAARAYDAGDGRRLNDGWSSVNQPGHVVDRASRDAIRGRARDLERNSDILESIVLAFERNVVGTGFTLQPKITKAGGDIDDPVNDKVLALWRDWCRPRNCDVQARLSFNEMCRMAIRRMRVDGGIFFIKCYTDRGIIPLSLQMREVDDLDTTVSAGKLKNGNYIVDGIEVDEWGRHVAYYFKTYLPDGYTTTEPKRVEADRVIYLQKINRPSQVREMSPLAPSLSRIKDINQYVEAVNVQARIAACFAMAVKKMTPNFGLGRGVAGAKTDAATGYLGQSVTPGMIYHLQPGDEVAAVNPPILGSSPKDLLNIQQRLAAAGQGVSYEVGSRDMSMVNYSSARQGLLEDMEEYREHQQYLVDHMLYEVYTEFLISAALKGLLPFDIAQLLRDKPRYMAHRFIPRGWAWIDPLKEAKANETALSTGQETLERICAEKGLDWREVIEQRGREREAMAEAGLLATDGERGFLTAD